MKPEHSRWQRWRARMRPQTDNLPAGVLPWLLAVAAAAAAPHALHLPPPLSIAGAALLLTRLWLWRRQRPLPGSVLRALVTLAGVVFIVRHFGVFFGRDSGVALLFFFIALKPMEIHRRRDAMILILLALFLLLTHYFYSESLLTGLWLAASVTLILMTLMRLAGGSSNVRTLLRHSGLMLAQAAPLMLFLFILFPRINGPLWGLPQDAHQGKTGLSEQMSPGSFSDLILSDEVAFRVQFANQRIPPRHQLYWRGPVLTDYDGEKWYSHPPLRHQAAPPPQIEISDNAQRYAYTTTLEAHNMHWLLALDLPFERPPNTHFSAAFEARSEQPLRQRSRFHFTANTSFSVNRTERPQILQRALQLPAQRNPRSHALARQWREQLQQPQAISNAALQYFRQQAFYYTLRPPLTGKHAIDDFLFQTRRGFCEHYAAAYVVLMRAAGIPARVVTGYQGGESNPIDGLLTVRQSSAHAWAEIWLKDKGWLRIDPTAAVAPSRIEHGLGAALPAADPRPALMRLNAPWLHHLRHRWEALNSTWQQWVIAYDQQRQRDLLSLLPGLQEPDWRQLLTLLFTALAISLMPVVLRIFYPARNADPTQRLWHKFRRQLSRHGVQPHPWEGPLALAQRIRHQHPHLVRITKPALNAWTCLRYHPPASPRRQQAWRQQLRNTTRQLAQQKPSPAKPQEEKQKEKTR